MSSFKDNFKIKNVILMLVSVFFMGVGVFFLKLSSFGPDPFSAMNYGISGMLHISFGTFGLLLNIVLIVFLFIFDRSLLGAGTIGNMVIVGYAADFTAWAYGKLFPDMAVIENIGIRIAIVIPALILFIISAALYMNSRTGTSPYDALSFFLHKIINKKTKKQIPFRFIRICYDAFFTLMGVLFHGEVGIATVIMIFTLGPAVDAVGKLLNKKSDKESLQKNTDM